MASSRDLPDPERYREHRKPDYDHYDQSSVDRCWGRGWLKVHEGCGGFVRYREAVGTFGLGWHATCDECGRDVVEEQIVFVTKAALPKNVDVEDFLNLPITLLRDLEYPMGVQESDGFAAAQDRIRDQIYEALTDGD